MSNMPRISQTKSNPLTPIMLLVLVPLLVLGGLSLITWFNMLLLGAASIASDGVVPALGFEPTLYLTVIGLLMRGSSYSSKS